ncbi:DUF2141 domain-containing protein [Novosphingobium flavum]|uniref:DUF2141 domain-containing protein n=2 Tax=Novosphingobium flavum TaxID=1778672 RepID=A0A7X1KK35_9SPHN|nr:DUF2141 domain-containing protein [Novosphingobium flavum]
MAWPARWAADLSAAPPSCAANAAGEGPSWCDAAWLDRQKVEIGGEKQRSASYVASGPQLGKAEGLCRPGEPGPALLVDVAGLKDHVGNVKLEVYPANDDDFLDDDDALVAEHKVFRRVEQPLPASGPATVCVRIPGPGAYSLVVLHDRNGDHKFNFTSEGIGFAGNPRIGLGLPSASEAAVVVTGSGLSRTAVVMNYRTGFLKFSPLARR